MNFTCRIGLLDNYLQNNRRRRQELPRCCELFPVVDLLPVSIFSRVPGVDTHPRCSLDRVQEVEMCLQALEQDF